MTTSSRPGLRKKLTISAMVAFFNKALPTMVAIEACGAAHQWARVLTAIGQTVKLIAPPVAKPYVKRGKNNAADAEALAKRPAAQPCAVSRPRPSTSRPP